MMTYAASRLLDPAAAVAAVKVLPAFSICMNSLAAKQEATACTPTVGEPRVVAPASVDLSVNLATSDNLVERVEKSVTGLETKRPLKQGLFLNAVERT